MYEIYKVLSNDSLEIIANKYEISVEEILELNGFPTNYQPIPGSELIVPAKNNKNKIYKYYTVKKGDNIYDIAKKNNIDYNLLLKLNGLERDDYIYPNQTIILPKTGLTIYLTKSGDTIDDVLENMNTNIDELLSKNKNVYLAPEQIIIFEEK